MFLLMKLVGFVLITTTQSSFAEPINTLAASSSCHGEVEGALQSFEAAGDLPQKWLQMVNASGAPNLESLRKFENTFPGSYDDCMALEETRYCAAELHATIGSNSSLDVTKGMQRHRFGLSIGLCLPRNCSREDLEPILDRTSSLALELYSVDFDYDFFKAKCYPRPDEFRRPMKFFVFVAFLATLSMLVAFATVNELINRSKTTKTRNVARSVLNCFSLATNGSHLFSTKERPKEIKILHFFRVQAILIIIYGHTWFYAKHKSNNLMEMVQDMSDTFYESFMMNTGLSVDTFFLMSGLLVSYLCLDNVEQLRRNFFLTSLILVIKRYLRLTPLYAFVIWVQVALIDDLVPWPLWRTHEDFILNEAKNCATGFWQNLLYVNNFNYEVGAQCIDHSWYLANDFQFFVAATLLVIPLIARKRFAVAMISFVTLTSMVVTFVISYSQDAAYLVRIKPIETVSRRSTRGFLRVYMKPYCRFGAYGIGLLLGMALHEKKSMVFYFRRFTTYATVVLALGMLAAPMLITYHFHYEGVLLDVHTSLVRVIWALGISILIYLAHISQRSHFSEQGSVAKFFMSSRWAPLSKLTYSVYLIHVVIMKFYFASLKETFAIDRSITLQFFLFFVPVSYSTGIVLFLLVQRPAERLCSLFEQSLSHE